MTEKPVGRVVGRYVLLPKDDPGVGRLYERGFGIIHGEWLVLFDCEALYLLKNNKIKVKRKNKELTFDELADHFSKIDKNFKIRYAVYEDLRNRGYLLKSGLKYGADFRVYDRGHKPGREHSKWIAICVPSTGEFSWKDFAALNRVAHSVRKNLLICVVDEELDVTYYETRWVRP